jgi:hypothetical protein
MTKTSNDLIDEFTARDGLIIGGLAAFLYFGLIYIGYDSIADGTMIATGVILGTIRIFWPLRRRIWFWVTMGCISILHAAAVSFVPLSSNAFSGVRIAPVAAADFVASIVIVNLLAKVFERRHQTTNRSSDTQTENGETD